jgi:zinc protease
MIPNPLTSGPWYEVIWRRLTPTLLVLASSAGTPTLASAGLFEAHMFQLSNGMQVVLVPDHRAPVVTHMLWYRVGSADETPGKSGLAHFFEHLMFKGTTKYPEDAYSRLIGRVGGELNAFTSYDYTAYYATVHADSLELVMALEADRMLNLTLSEEMVRIEREVIVEERRLRIDNNPEALLHEQVMAALFLNHRYGVPVIGWMQEIRSWTLDDVLAFYRRWYRPGNATLVVAGDVALERLHALAEKHYGVLPPAPTSAQKRPIEPEHIAARRVAVQDRRIKRSLWMRFYLAPAYGSPEKHRTPAVEILAELLGGGPNSLLYRQLVRTLGLAAEVRVSYSPEATDQTTLAIVAVPAPGVSVSDLEQAINLEVTRIRDGAIDDADVQRVQRKMRALAIRLRDGTMPAAQAMGAALSTGATLDEIEAWPTRIGAVTAADVRAEAKTVLRDEASVTGVLLPNVELGEALDQVFGDLPDRGMTTAIPAAVFVPSDPLVVRLPFPQSTCVFGQVGVRPTSPDYLPAIVLNHIVGGGTLTSRLFVELRDKRGLVYSVRTMLEPLSDETLMIGGFATENDKVPTTTDLVRREWRRLASGDVSEADIDEAKAFLKGALPLSLDGTSTIAGRLLAVQRLGLDIDHLTAWNAKVDAVTAETVRALARRLMRPDALTFAVAGEPTGM